MTLADRRPLTNAYEPPLPAVRRWSICGAGLGFGPQSSQTGSQTNNRKRILLPFNKKMPPFNRRIPPFKKRMLPISRDQGNQVTPLSKAAGRTRFGSEHLHSRSRQLNF